MKRELIEIDPVGDHSPIGVVAAGQGARRGFSKLLGERLDE